MAPARVEQKPVESGQVAAESVLGTDPSLKFKGIPYADIIAEWWKRNGGVPQEGERNVKLYQLAVSLRAICDNNKSLLMQVMPRLGLEEQELHAIVESACKETPKGISKMMQAVLQAVGVGGTVGEPAEPRVPSTGSGTVITVGREHEPTPVGVGCAD